MTIGSVNDNNSSGKIAEGTKPTAAADKAPKQKNIDTLARVIANDPVQVEVSPRPEKKNQMRVRANEIINAVNMAAEATEEIEKLARSLDGIVGQALDNKDTSHRLEALESEANQLIDAIKEKAVAGAKQSASAPGSETELEVEQELRKTLEALFPEGAHDAFGIGSVKFDPPDNIIKVRSSVAEAKQRIEDLRSSMGSIKDNIESAVSAIDVATQNTEAAQSSIRDLDNALETLSRTKTEMHAEPEQAVNVNQFTIQALDLLES